MQRYLESADSSNWSQLARTSASLSCAGPSNFSMITLLASPSYFSLNCEDLSARPYNLTVIEYLIKFKKKISIILWKLLQLEMFWKSFSPSRSFWEAERSFWNWSWREMSFSTPARSTSRGCGSDESELCSNFSWKVNLSLSSSMSRLKRCTSSAFLSLSANSSIAPFAVSQLILYTLKLSFANIINNFINHFILLFGNNRF